VKLTPTLPWPEYRNLVVRITDGRLSRVSIRYAWRRGLSPLHCKEFYNAAIAAKEAGK